MKKKDSRPSKKRRDAKNYVYRSSITGKIVTATYAKDNPDTTYKDTIKK